MRELDTHVNIFNLASDINSYSSDDKYLYYFYDTKDAILIRFLSVRKENL